MESVLLQAGLKRLVARALRRRVRSFRDIVDGAHFFGRTWTLASKEAPQVDVSEHRTILSVFAIFLLSHTYAALFHSFRK